MIVLINGINILTLFGFSDIANQANLYARTHQRLEASTWDNTSGIQIDDRSRRISERAIDLGFNIKVSDDGALYQMLETIQNYFITNECVITFIFEDLRKAYAMVVNGSIAISEKSESEPIKAYLTIPILLLNPLAKIFSISGNSYSLVYGNNQPSKVYWGDGTAEIVDGAGTYVHNYGSTLERDIVLDIDFVDYTSTITPVLVSISPTSGNFIRIGGTLAVTISCVGKWRIENVPDNVMIENIYGLSVRAGFGNTNIIITFTTNPSEDSLGGNISFISQTDDVELFAYNQDGIFKRLVSTGNFRIVDNIGTLRRIN